VKVRWIDVRARNRIGFRLRLRLMVKVRKSG